MVFGLVRDIASYVLQIRLADAKIGVSSLPLKIREVVSLLFEPGIRSSFV